MGKNWTKFSGGGDRQKKMALDWAHAQEAKQQHDKTCPEMESTGPERQGKATDNLEKMPGRGCKKEWLHMEGIGDSLSRQRGVEVFCSWPIPCQW